jgi:hypothetical protein
MNNRIQQNQESFQTLESQLSEELSQYAAQLGENSKAGAKSLAADWAINNELSAGLASAQLVTPLHHRQSSNQNNQLAPNDFSNGEVSFCAHT